MHKAQDSFVKSCLCVIWGTNIFRTIVTLLYLCCMIVELTAHSGLKLWSFTMTLELHSSPRLMPMALTMHGCYSVSVQSLATPSVMLVNLVVWTDMHSCNVSLLPLLCPLPLFRRGYEILWSVCLCLCICLCVYLSAHISQKPHVQTSVNFLWPWLNRTRTTVP